LIGRSNRPLKNTAIVTARALFGRLAPIVSRMYSIDLRYHWLLNDEKWWTDEDHCLKISRWQRAQVSPRKKFAGMMPRTLVSADEGRTGCWPAASPRPCWWAR
jgi:hypothetical protein